MICNYPWDIKAASVVCRQLGFTYAASAYDVYLSAEKTVNIYEKIIRCFGNESSIFQCAHTERRTTDRLDGYFRPSASLCFKGTYNSVRFSFSSPNIVN